MLNFDKCSSFINALQQAWVFFSVDLFDCLKTWAHFHDILETSAILSLELNFRRLSRIYIVLHHSSNSVTLCDDIQTTWDVIISTLLCPC